MFTGILRLRNNQEGLMKFIFSLFFITSLLYSQQCIFFIPLHEIKDSTERTITFEDFERDYQSAGSFLNGDSISNAWYNSFSPKLKEIFSDSISVLEKETKLWINLGCLPDGKIEKVIYFSKDIQTQKLDKTFQLLLKQLFENYSFPLKTEKKYSQCGSFKFHPNKESSLK